VEGQAVIKESEEDVYARNFLSVAEQVESITNYSIALTAAHRVSCRAAMRALAMNVAECNRILILRIDELDKSDAEFLREADGPATGNPYR
jgi:hypothetical protein